MEILHIIEIIIVVICAITYGLMLYFRVRGNVLGAVSEFVALAESTGLAGSEKMSQVVSELYEKVPGFFKKFLSEDKLEKIAQNIFDWMRQYADEYIKQQALVVSIGDPVEIAGQLSSLMNLTREELVKKAAEYGIEATPGMTRQKIFEAIISVTLKTE